MLEVLITDNVSDFFEIILKDDKEKRLDLKNRFKYSSEEYEITIIEIKKSDKINNFLELDDKIFDDIINNEIKEYEEYKYSPIYQVSYSRYEKELFVSYGMIYDKKDKLNFKYIGNKYAIGSPILELNNKVIGINLGCYNNRNKEGFGHFLNYPIKEFIQKYYYKNNNNQKEISIKENDNFNFNLIKKYLGQDIFKKLEKLYFSFNISFPRPSICSEEISFNLESCKIIINQMENYVCKIKVGNKEVVGFPCKIPFPNEDNLLKVFIINNSILNEDILNKKNENILINLNKKNKLINLSNRRKYSSKEYNTTIIEMKDNDGINNYLEIDDYIMEAIVDKNKEESLLDYVYKDKKIYMIKKELGILTTTYSYIEHLDKNQKYFIFRINKKKKKNN